MFDIGWDEMLFTVIIAIVVIGPKDLPRALRFAGQWIGKIRRVSNHFRSGIETMIREAEMEEMEQKWRDQNAKIMAETGVVEPVSDPHATPAMTGPLALPTAEAPALAVATGSQPEPASAEAAILPPPP
jgi:sec-independent protein translocase protein TatB